MCTQKACISVQSYTTAAGSDSVWMHLLAVDPLEVEVVEPVDDEGAPQRQTDHRVPLRVDGQLIQTPHLSQCGQLEKATNVGF